MFVRLLNDMYLHFFFQIADIVAIHKEQCPNFTEKKIQLSCDGVHESKSSSVSIDVYSIAFKNCKNVYPHKLVRQLGPYKVDHQQVLREIVKNITNNGLRIMQYVGDNPKRSNAKCVKGHSSWHPCEYCYAKGVKIEVVDNERARKKINDQIEAVQAQILQIQQNQVTEQSQVKINNLMSLKDELVKSQSALKRKSNILWPASTINSEFR